MRRDQRSNEKSGGGEKQNRTDGTKGDAFVFSWLIVLQVHRFPSLPRCVEQLITRNGWLVYFNPATGLIAQMLI